jgi:hypothetical protein
MCKTYLCNLLIEWVSEADVSNNALLEESERSDTCFHTAVSPSQPCGSNVPILIEQ